jgi:hypothetical protein
MAKASDRLRLDEKTKVVVALFAFSEYDEPTDAAMSRLDSLPRSAEQ